MFATPAAAQQMAVAGPGAVQGAPVGAQGAAVVETGEVVDPLSILLERSLAARPATADETTSLLYLQRAYRPLWDDAARAGALLAALERLDTHGLDARDFEPERLRSQLAVPADIEARVTRELLLSDTLARVVKQLRYGKLDPRTLYREWNFTPPANPYARALALAQLLQRADLQAAIEAQAPSSPLYRALQAALAEYAVQAASGDWPTIPAGPTLRPGQRSARVPALRARLALDGEEGLDAVSDARRYDPALEAAVERFQLRHGLAADGIVGGQTLRALNTSPAERADQIRANLERLRWVSADLGGDRLYVDIVGYHADLVLDGQTVWASRVIVGKPTRKTPSLRDSVVNLVLNPKWVVPPTIMREDVIPAAARNPAYLANHRLRVVGRGGQTVNPPPSTGRRRGEAGWVTWWCRSRAPAARSGASSSRSPTPTPSICTTPTRVGCSGAPSVRSARAACGCRTPRTSPCCCSTRPTPGAPTRCRPRSTAGVRARCRSAGTCRCCCTTPPQRWTRRGACNCATTSTTTTAPSSRRSPPRRGCSTSACRPCARNLTERRA